MTKTKSRRSLKLIIIFLVGACLVIFNLILFFIFQGSLSGMLLRAENKYLEQQLDVVAGLFSAANENAYLMAADTGNWQAAAEFANGLNPNFIQDNWPGDSMLQSYQFNLVVIKDSSGRDVYAEFHDYLQGIGLPVPPGFTDALDNLARTTLEKFRQNQATLPEAEHHSGGILFFENVPYYVAAAPIIPLPEAVEPAGTFFFGIRLSNEYFRSLTHYSTVNFTLIRSGGAGQNEAISRENSQLVSTSLHLSDLDGNPVELRMSDNRTIFQEGQAVLNTAALLLILLSLLLALSLYQIVMRVILRPIEQLSKDVGNVASAGDISEKDYSASKEFDVLCRSISDMIQRLDQSKVSMDTLLRILNGMNAYLYVSDPDTDEILFINDKMTEHYGIQGKVEGQVCWQTLQTGITKRCDFCPIHKLNQDPGSLVFWEERSSATGRYYRNMDCLIEWVDKRLVHLQHSVDITDVKIAEAALQKRLEQQELMFAISQSFVSTADMTEKINAALRVAGSFMDVAEVALVRHHEAEQLVRTEYFWRNERCPFYPDDLTAPFHPGIFAHDAFILAKEAYHVLEDISEVSGLEHLAAQGIRSLICIPVHVAGVFWGLLSISENVEDRVWSESDIQLARQIGSFITGVLEHSVLEDHLERMSSIVNSSPQFVSYINETGAFEYLNQGAQCILGYSAEELVTGGLSLIFDAKTHARIIAELLPRVLREGREEFELPVIRKDGQTRILAFSAFRTDFKILGVGAIASDITEKRLLEQELIAAKEQAEQSSRAKGEFLSRMSHEMRTPMNAVIGMTSIAKSSKDPEQKEYCLDKINEASTHLLGVINDILDMAKIEANKFELSHSEFRLEKMLVRVVNVLNFRIEEKKQSLIINLDPAVPAVIISDQQRLAQVIANLLSNAVKFTPDKGSITLSVKRLDDKDDFCTLQFSVRDTGIGIAKEQLDKLFRSFEQADGSIARKFGGTGLGLSISKSIVELMNGQIWANSELGRGSEFTFTILTRHGGNSRPAMLGPDVNWENLRILVVDDAPEVREYFLNFAQSSNIACEVAEDGFSACRLLENSGKTFNIAFVDWQMPGMNGVELTRKIKAGFGAKTVVIMISAISWNDIAAEAEAAGVDRFIPKPLFVSALVDCINECLGLPGQEHAEEEIGRSEDGCFAGHRVLLVEDIEINREIVVTLLEHTELDIEHAENGLQAFEMFLDNPGRYDMIFMDIHMPEVDGYEATRRIRALGLPEAASIPIVAMTANVFREDIEHCLAVGMNDHLGKPIDFSEIMDKLHRYLAV